MKLLSIVIPVFNEENFIAAVIEKVLKTPTHGYKKELIVIDDGSTDKTNIVLSNLKFKIKNLKLLRHEKNQGKGAALKVGFALSKGDIVVVQDGDLEYNPDDYQLLLEPFRKGQADVVYGSRFVTNRPHRVLYFWHSIGNSVITSLSNIFTNLNLTDIETGYKAFRGDLIRKIAKQLKSNRFGFEVEITARISKIKSLRIYEVGISYWGRKYEEGKKINWTDGVKAIFQVVKYNILTKD